MDALKFLVALYFWEEQRNFHDKSSKQSNQSYNTGCGQKQIKCLPSRKVICTARSILHHSRHSEKSSYFYPLSLIISIRWFASCCIPGWLSTEQMKTLKIWENRISGATLFSLAEIASAISLAFQWWTGSPTLSLPWPRRVSRLLFCILDTTYTNMNFNNILAWLPLLTHNCWGPSLPRYGTKHLSMNPLLYLSVVSESGF